MKLDLFQIDAFTNKSFGGNPACVVALEEWLSDETLLKIAAENAVAETAFFIIKNAYIDLRWFTPEIEMDLCGHATLATAHCLKVFYGYEQNPIKFQTAAGELSVGISGKCYQLSAPSREPIPAELPEIIKDSLNIQPIEVLKSRDYVLVYESEEDIRSIEINQNTFDQINLDPGGIVVTAPGFKADFVSRFFTPQASILEDPVTGSAHCSLIPYWAKKLKKNKMCAQQLSERIGNIGCEFKEDHVVMSGMAKTYLQGSIWVD